MALKRDELINPEGCLNRAANDEPIFVLRANDELAASVVRVWAQYYYARKVALHGDLTTKQRKKYDEALQLAQQMDDWRRSEIRAAKTALNKSFGKLGDPSD
jgi:hypothetical protein